MVELKPIPFALLLARLKRDLAAGGAVFGMERKHFYKPAPGLDLTVSIGGLKAGNPLGPAAGPHTQLAQNMILGWLGGARIFELKTLQVLDQLELPRPCIHAPDLAFNVEWSQELRLQESLREYAKTRWLLDLLVRRASELDLPDGPWLDAALDLSVGYNFDGLTSATMRKALSQAKQPQSLYHELASELNPELRGFAGPPPAGPLARTITLSTFHGCPPDEIESMTRYLIEDGWNVVVKFNPTLLGEAELRHLLHEQMGYHDLELDPEGIAADLTLDQAIPMIERLQDFAIDRGRELGVKFSNTLILKNKPEHFPAQRDRHMYLSGPPLYPLALATADLVCSRLSRPIGLSFSAGIDRRNIASTLACGFVPLTFCTELLKQGGYARIKPMLGAIEKEMQEAGSLCLKDHQGLCDNQEESWTLLQQRIHAAAEAAAAAPRYASEKVRKTPRRQTVKLETLDCCNCKLCITVCPNNAFFAWPTRPDEDGVKRSFQLAYLADACNACGNCNTWCPEAGDPIALKPRIVLDSELWQSDHSAGLHLSDKGKLESRGMEDQPLLIKLLVKRLFGDPELSISALIVRGHA